MLAFILGLTQAHSHDLSGGVDLSDCSSGGPLARTDERDERAPPPYFY